MVAGELNPVELLWLDDPAPGPALLEGRARDLLEETGEVPDGAVDQLRVRWSVPGENGVWHGHVTHAGAVHYRLVANGATPAAGRSRR